MMKNEPEDLIYMLVEGQKKRLLQISKRIIPTVAMDDLWQPNDFPDLENHPEFRYEEGVLHGMLAVATALRANDRSPLEAQLKPD